jgi:hypothetical protein
MLVGGLVFAGGCGAAEQAANDARQAAEDTRQAAADRAALAAADAAASAVEGVLHGLGFESITTAGEQEVVDGQTVTVISANVVILQLQDGCALNYEAPLTNPTGVYFDEVITPDEPDGVEVTGEARNSILPLHAFQHVLREHPECLIPGAEAPRL